jgi:hypothetical protein
MRFEARHQIFKDLAKSTHCFKNICLTLAKRFQLALAYKFLNNKFDSQLSVAGQSEEVTVNTLPADIMSSICTDLKVCPYDTVFELRWMQVGHYVFKAGAVSVNSVYDGMLQFGIVRSIVSLQDRIYFVEELLQTNVYDEHFHAFSVKYPSRRRFACIAVDTLLNHVPLPYHNVTYERHQHLLISLRYVLF